jgi:hypothetical protein
MAIIAKMHITKVFSSSASTGSNLAISIAKEPLPFSLHPGHGLLDRLHRRPPDSHERF